MRKRVGEEVRGALVGLDEANKGANDFQNQGPQPTQAIWDTSQRNGRLRMLYPTASASLEGAGVYGPYLKKATRLRASRMDVTTLCTSAFPGPVPESFTTGIKVVSWETSRSPLTSSVPLAVTIMK